MTAKGLRDIIRDVSPPWKKTGFFEKLDYSVFLVADALIDKFNQALAARIPSRTLTSTSLPLIGADRLITKGIIESTTSYGLRLQRAFDDWFFAGSARSILGQVLGYLSPVGPVAKTVTNRSVWDYYTDGADTRQAPRHLQSGTPGTNPENWNWDDNLTSTNGLNATRWHRFWLILRDLGTTSGLSWTAKGPVYGTFAATGAKWGDTTRSWGLSVPANVIRSIRSIVGLWKPANTRCLWMIVAFDSSLFPQSNTLPDSNLPDGKWGPWHKIDVGADGRIIAVASRAANARYCDGVTNV